MPRFAANLSMMYPELPFLDRFEAAAKDGFKAVEYLFPYAFAKEELVERLQANNLQQVLFNAPPGGTDAASIDRAWNGGDKGITCIPGREDEFRAGVALALDYAQALGCPRIHLMAGLLPAGVSREAAHAPTWPTCAGPPLRPPDMAATC
jgi:hydroxypyruvate isomerase